MAGKNALDNALLAASKHFEKDEYAQALPYCEKALELDSESLLACILKAESFYELQRFDDAIKWYDQIDISQCEKDDAILFCTHKALSHAYMGDEQESLDCIDGALEIDSKQAKIWYQKALLLSDTKSKKKLPRRRLEEAIHCHNMAIYLDRSRADVMYHKGVVLSGSGDKHGAISSFDDVIRTDPGYLVAYVAKGNALESLSDYQGAVKCYTVALRRHPKNIMFIERKAHALYKLGKFRDSINMLQKALDVDLHIPGARDLIDFMEQRLYVRNHGHYV